MYEKLAISISNFLIDIQQDVTSSPAMGHFTHGNLELVEKFSEPDNHDHT